MPDPDSSSGAFDPGNGEPPYEWLDEWLCEYVDGAMDPSLETMFEQYVEANPKLKAHVERLCKTRELLAKAGSADPSSSSPSIPNAAPDPPAHPLPASAEPVVPATFGPFAVLSSVTVALLIGFLAGTLFVGALPAPAPTDASTATTAPLPTWTVDETLRRTERPPARPEARRPATRSALDSTDTLPIFSTSHP
jgi:anti-sigma factor RsiW